MREYARHKRMVSDVHRFINSKQNPDRLERVMHFAGEYLSLRITHPEINDEELGYAIRKINPGAEIEMNELYETLIESLTRQQYVFRIKRIKYVKDTRDSVLLVASPLLKKLGKYMNQNMIQFNKEEVKVMNQNIEPEAEPGKEPEENIEKAHDEIPEAITEAKEELPQNEPVSSPIEKVTEAKPEENTEEEKPVKEKKPRAKRERHPDIYLCDADPELNEINKLWDSPDERDKWLVANVSTKSKKYGYEIKGKYDATTVGKAVGVDQGTVLFYLRKKILEKK